MKLKLITTILFSAIILTALSGCLKKEVKPEIKNNIKQPPIATTTEEVDLPVWPEEKYTEKDYQGWKVYINEKLGYKIKYPAGWIINACDEGCSSKEVIINPPNAEDFTSYISISIEDGYSLEEIRQGYKVNTPKGIEAEVVFSNKKSYQFKYNDCPINKNCIDSDRTIFVPYNNKIYDINTHKDNNPQVRQALASFEFIE